MLAPEVHDIRAELYKLNIYTAPNDHFKAHVDTPRGGLMFGSLVVCLPSKFSGGALVTRHNGHTTTYDWSGGPNHKNEAVIVTRAKARALPIQWAAFFSDVEHEIFPVTEGHRITLTYNLYHCDKASPVPTIDITTSSIYRNLKEALAYPHFLHDGGILGFTCQHAYVLESDKGNLPRLEGSDHAILLAAKALDLEVQVKPVMKLDNGSYYNYTFRL